MSKEETLERNLNRLRKKNAPLAESLRKISLEQVEIGEGPRGAATLTDDGILLASAYDPVGEGQKLAGEMAKGEADCIVVIGFSLGHHLEAYRALRPGAIVVYEPSMERLKAALSVRPSMMLLGAKDFEITCDLDYLLGLVNRFYSAGVKLKVFPHPSLMRIAPDVVRDVVSRLRRTKEASDISTITRYYKAAGWAMSTAKHAEFIRTTPSLACLYDKFQNVPAVVIAAGPSLNKQLPLLKQYQERVLIVCIGQSVGAVREAGIEPHLIHILESQNVLQQLDRAGDPGQIRLVITPDTHVSLYEAPARCRFVATPGFNGIGQWLAKPMGIKRWTAGGGTVAQGAVGLAMALGSKQIMLIGQDLAFTGGKVYADNTAYDCVGLEMDDDNESIRLTNSQAKGKLLGLETCEDRVKKSILWVEGWDGEKVPTCYSYATFIEQYRTIGPQMEAQGIRLINCTEGGALIPNLRHETFARSLQEHAHELVNPLAIIEEAHDAWEPTDVSEYQEPLRKVRRILDRVEEAASKGLQQSEKAKKELQVTKAPQRQLDILRRVGKAERRIRTDLTGTTWLDQLVQPVLVGTSAIIRKAGTALPTPQQAVDESIYLFSATLEGVEKGRELFDSIDDAFSAGVELKTGRNPSEGGASATPTGIEDKRSEILDRR